MDQQALRPRVRHGNPEDQEKAVEGTLPARHTKAHAATIATTTLASTTPSDVVEVRHDNSIKRLLIKFAMRVHRMSVVMMLQFICNRFC